MTRLETPIKDVLGTKYYTYQLRATKYNPVLNETITIVCAVSNDYDAEQPSSVILYQNDVEIGPGTLQTSGMFIDHYTWTITCDTPGLQIFRVKDTSISVYVENELMDMIYPVGSIYMSVNSTSPETLFGGTWERLKDRFLLASGDTYNNGATGGSSTVSLTQSQMPRHTHTQNGHSHGPAGDYDYFIATPTNSGAVSRNSTAGQSGTKVQNLLQHASGVARTNTDSVTATNKYTGGSGSAESASNGSAHENMPPYLAVYMWKRTA